MRRRGRSVRRGACVVFVPARPLPHLPRTQGRGVGKRGRGARGGVTPMGGALRGLEEEEEVGGYSTGPVAIQWGQWQLNGAGGDSTGPVATHRGYSMGPVATHGGYSTGPVATQPGWWRPDRAGGYSTGLVATQPGLWQLVVATQWGQWQLNRACEQLMLVTQQSQWLLMVATQPSWWLLNRASGNSWWLLNQASGYSTRTKMASPGTNRGGHRWSRSVEEATGKIHHKPRRQGQPNLVDLNQWSTEVEAKSTNP
ncbi:uncharacterized protein LOC121084501 isoform X2 [Falco naumanni]|uniref:uncharacterized protein LOC121084501 isoform X2 n=1 Tax=Falco naumanni TaxID=148594 RepID=UPI001ADE0ADB|nr:uncharacterized protein LOC121084501 isoform X2 [Falco naumanni]